MQLIRYNTPADLSAWTPFFRLSPLRDLLDTALERNGSCPGSDGPPLDVRVSDESVTVTLELAGMKKEDFDLLLEDETLTVSGRRETEPEDRRSQSLRCERFAGAFSRTVALPCAVKGDRVQAIYEEGVLTVTLPKAEEARPRKIAVKLN